MSFAEARPRSAAEAWWWSLDRVALALIVALAAVGVLLSLAAGPAAAARLGLSDPFHFVVRHAVHLSVAGAILIAVSTLSARDARRVAVLALLVAAPALLAALLWGVEVNGARRWLTFGPVSVQPVEFAKPAFIVTAAWLIAEERRGAGPPGLAVSGGMLAVLAALLLAQPDVGQTALLAAVFAGLVFLGGASWRVLAGLAAALAAVAAAVAVSAPHVVTRLLVFWRPEAGAGYQLERGLEAVRRGGLFGVGPGEGEVKHQLPDAHTDFVFAVAAEEFGALLCIAVLAAFAILTMRVLRRARDLVDPTAGLAASGLALLIAVQALINMAVNLGVIPTKGMTLPFMSYGGSSLVAMGLTAGLILAFTRRRPGAYAPAG
ncbi:MAG: FtsW/RodA/SpoVE family cell cycle protein [Caulobacterales bacterium]|nr:FtsW/RodA/SpoVE family cell cycle protein [Caulobacterales bacterium]